METKHTPGPWIVTPVPRDDPKDTRATRYRVTRDRGDGWHESLLRHGAIELGDGDPRCMFLSEANARAAIAKATGQS